MLCQANTEVLIESNVIWTFTGTMKILALPMKVLSLQESKNAL